LVERKRTRQAKKHYEEGGSSMSKKRVFIAVGLVLALSMAILLTLPERAFTRECRIIRINQSPDIAGAIALEPDTIWVEKGTCVVWFNKVRTQTPEVQLKFRDGKKCQEMTEAPVGFSYDSIEDCYVTNWIPIYGTSSLRFMQPGTYEYEVSGKGKETATGKIVVEE